MCLGFPEAQSVLHLYPDFRLGSRERGNRAESDGTRVARVAAKSLPACSRPSQCGDLPSFGRKGDLLTDGFILEIPFYRVQSKFVCFLSLLVSLLTAPPRRLSIHSRVASRRQPDRCEMCLA